MQDKTEATNESNLEVISENQKSSKTTEGKPEDVTEKSDTDNSEAENVHINKFGAQKTSRWNRPKIDLSVKDLEKVPTRRSKRIHNLQKEKCQSQV